MAMFIRFLTTLVDGILLNRFVRSLLGFTLTKTITSVPGMHSLVIDQVEKEVDKTVSDIFSKDNTDSLVPPVIKIPREGVPVEEIEKRLALLKKCEVNTEEGTIWAFTYHHGMKEIEEMAIRVHNMFMSENALNPMAFPSLKKFERDVVSMTASMLGASEEDGIVGNMSTGGTESILLAMKTYRDRAKNEFNITKPEIVMPFTAHPAFNKAASYFGIKAIRVPIEENTGMVIVEKMKKAINKNTICLIGSACQYAHGIVDPIEEIAKLALEKKLPLHVDACMGGFMLPWVKALGYPVPPFDFSVEGVTSISADLHKFGFAPKAKGASVIMYRDAALWRYQFYVFEDWPGGLFASPTLLGTRGGGTIAASWALLQGMGQDGYKKALGTAKETQVYIRDAIKSDFKGELQVIGDPPGTILSFKSLKLNIMAIADVMEDDFGWTIEKQANPDCIHMTIMPQHFKIREKFVKNLKASIEKVRSNPSLEETGSAAMYGMVAKIPSKMIVHDFLGLFLSKLYSKR